MPGSRGKYNSVWEKIVKGWLLSYLIASERIKNVWRES